MDTGWPPLPLFEVGREARRHAIVTMQSGAGDVADPAIGGECHYIADPDVCENRGASTIPPSGSITNEDRDMQQFAELEEQLFRLRDYEDIRALKARYLFACDNKDPKGMRACFADGRVHIDYGVIGTFDSADKLVALYTQLACHDHIIEMHHGSNPQIEVFDDGTAKGRWSLHYQQIDTQNNTLTQLGAYYDDKYRKVHGGWKIVETRCVVTSTLVLDLGSSAVRKLIAARQAPIPETQPV